MLLSEVADGWDGWEASAEWPQVLEVLKRHGLVRERGSWAAAWHADDATFNVYRDAVELRVYPPGLRQMTHVLTLRVAAGEPVAGPLEEVLTSLKTRSMRLIWCDVHVARGFIEDRYGRRVPVLTIVDGVRADNLADFLQAASCARSLASMLADEGYDAKVDQEARIVASAGGEDGDPMRQSLYLHVRTWLDHGDNTATTFALRVVSGPDEPSLVEASSSTVIAVGGPADMVRAARSLIERKRRRDAR